MNIGLNFSEFFWIFFIDVHLLQLCQEYRVPNVPLSTIIGFKWFVYSAAGGYCFTEVLFRLLRFLFCYLAVLHSYRHAPFPSMLSTTSLHLISKCSTPSASNSMLFALKHTFLVSIITKYVLYFAACAQRHILTSFLRRCLSQRYGRCVDFETTLSAYRVYIHSFLLIELHCKIYFNGQWGSAVVLACAGRKTLPLAVINWVLLINKLFSTRLNKSWTFEVFNKIPNLIL